MFKQIVTVASVHHTGTQFITHEILKTFEARSLDHRNLVAGPAAKDIWIRIHCEPQSIDRLGYWCSSRATIVPLRHPAKVAASWKARGKDLSRLVAQWNILKNIVDEHDPMYLPIDVPDRMNWLDTISRNIDRELQTDWPVVMSCNKSATLSENDKAAVIEVMADGFFDRFGYEV